MLLLYITCKHDIYGFSSKPRIDGLSVWNRSKKTMKRMTVNRSMRQLRNAKTIGGQSETDMSEIATLSSTPNTEGGDTDNDDHDQNNYKSDGARIAT